MTIYTIIKIKYSIIKFKSLKIKVCFRLDHHKVKMKNKNGNYGKP